MQNQIKCKTYSTQPTHHGYQPHDDAPETQGQPSTKRVH